MARSTQKEVALLMRDARGVTGQRTNPEAMTAVQAAADKFKRMVTDQVGDKLAVTFVSPYKNGAWSVSYIIGCEGGGCADISLYPPLETIVANPEAIATMVISDAVARGLMADPAEEAGPAGPGRR